MPAIYIANVSNAGEDDGYNLSWPVLTAIIVCTILFILLLLGFTLVWRYRRTFQRRPPPNPYTTTELARSPIQPPERAYAPKRTFSQWERSHG
ncbi:uncharacterized protein EV420DRAFT_1645124 [Desarmillaria tabescens]|uniref:Uncharacterized protein n=1 Tax=Armillaria tabescens TaxID=1929756 RepID=A0AA39N103_ARMTA|nr:uncharacterized protein EV420DRAFT_1645124 [Desarmillaria tabescens]KAK0454231.1 hypothetical protein EV420DRAFT_1645124 [Desarmillaria tabescens]